MFYKRKLIHRGRIESDEGFSVTFGRDWVAYCEANRRMVFTADFGGKTGAIFVDTIGRWDDDPSNTMSDEDKRKIAENVKRALEWDGMSVSLL